jgi:hypothetical protein
VPSYPLAWRYTILITIVSVAETMTPKYLLFAVGLVSIVTVAVAAVEVAVLSQIQQDADAKCRVGGTGYNASQGRCNPGLEIQANEEEEDTQADEEDTQADEVEEGEDN